MSVLVPAGDLDQSLAPIKKKGTSDEINSNSNLGFASGASVGRRSQQANQY
jgi:hypothetical protein